MSMTRRTLALALMPWLARDAPSQPPTLRSLLRRLRSLEPCERWQAAYDLGKLGDRRALKPLIQASIGDPDDAVRYDATMALGDLGDPGAIAHLVRMLVYHDDLAPGAAANALGKIGLPARDAVIDLLSHEEARIRGTALRILGGIRDPTTVERVRAVLEDVDEDVAVAAVEALAEIDSVDAREFVARACSDPRDDVAKTARYWSNPANNWHSL